MKGGGSARIYDPAARLQTVYPDEKVSLGGNIPHIRPAREEHL